MGCGKGRFTTEVAKRYPDALVMGAEISSLIVSEKLITKRLVPVAITSKRSTASAGNSLVSNFPIIQLIEFIFFVQIPWPKDRHRRNRMLSSEFMHRVTRKIKKGGIFTSLLMISLT